jgi:hypothetical protein
VVPVVVVQAAAAAPERVIPAILENILEDPESLVRDTRADTGIMAQGRVFQIPVVIQRQVLHTVVVVVVVQVAEAVADTVTESCVQVVLE